MASKNKLDQQQADILIIGAGLAGLFTAIKLAPLKVSIISAAPLSVGSSSAWAQGGIAAALSEGDSAEAHARDTMIAGCYLNDPEIVRIMTNEAALRVHELFEMGVAFDQDAQGKFLQGKEAAHSAHRIVKVGGDGAGRYVIDRLKESVLASEHITIHYPYVMFDLARNALGDVKGVYVRRLSESEPVLFRAHKVILATGGIGHLYAFTTNPAEIRGEGLGVSARHGIKLKDTEFVQFHPTAIKTGQVPAPLASEALRGEGAILINDLGELIMQHKHPAGDLAPRDIVARSVAAEYQKGRNVFLDTRQALGERILSEFPVVSQSCLAANIDPTKEPIPVTPAQHYHMGGVFTDSFGKTSVQNLFAVGEVACTAAHGANRLASNSLLEAVVFAARAAELILDSRLGAEDQKTLTPPIRVDRLYPKNGSFKTLRQLMFEQCGLLRTQSGLETAKQKLLMLNEAGQNTAPFCNYMYAALAIIEAAIARKDSLGAHYRSDGLENIVI